MALVLCRKSIVCLFKHSFSNPPCPHYHLASFLLFSSASKQETTKSISDYLVHHHQFSLETASKASSALAHLKSYENTDLTIKYLQDFGFSKSNLEKLVSRMPRILTANSDLTIKPKIQFLQHLGISPPDIVEIITADPWILRRGISNQLAPSILALKSLLGSDAAVLKVLKVAGGFLKYNLEKTMVPSIELMKSYGISQSQITRFVFNFPRLFLHKPETIKDYIKKVDEMGVDRNSGMFLHAIRVVSSLSAESWDSKLKLFRSLGFTEEDILVMFRKYPQVFVASERKIKEVSDVLLSTGEVDSTFIVKRPDFFLFSVQHRILPRLKIMDILGAKRLVKRRPNLTTLLKISEGKFFSEYVQPYSDVVGELYMASRAS